MDIQCTHNINVLTTTLYFNATIWLNNNMTEVAAILINFDNAE